MTSKDFKKDNTLKKYGRKVDKSLPKLFHLSFRDNLEGIWVPKKPAGDYSSSDDPDLLPEATGARVSVSPTLEQCFQAVYANIKHLFTKEHKELTFNVYKPIFKGEELIVHPKDLTKHKLVHDAHITEEYCILSPVFMKHIGTATIKEPDLKKKINYFAYDDKSAKEPYGWLPGGIKVIHTSTEHWFNY